MSDPQELVTLVTRPTEFEANLLVAILRDAGIQAFAFSALNSTLPMSGPFTSVPVQVKRVDFERAHRALAQNVADSVDLDWDQIDVGQREDRLPLSIVNRTPILAQLGFLVAIIALMCLLAAAIWMFIF